MDRRAVFFLTAAIVSIVLAPATDPKHRWVPEWLAVLYVVLALLSLLDTWGRHERRAADDGRAGLRRAPVEAIDQPNRPVM
jgi:hypothetical protein